MGDLFGRLAGRRSSLPAGVEAEAGIEPALTELQSAA